jgi:NTP pyrophosphatase (non-canonical NTP hydrolase)
MAQINVLMTWREDIASEIGDVLWYCAALATDLNLTLGMIAGQNEKKLMLEKMQVQ